MTMLIVTHHMRFAEHCADRVLFFENGVIADSARTAELFHACVMCVHAVLSRRYPATDG